MNENRFVITLVCDDVRREFGNKLSFMGVYDNELLVPKTPFQFSKLCFVISAYTPVECPFKALSLHLYKDQEVIATLVIDEASLNAEAARATTSDTPTRQVFKSIMQISPLTIESPCIFRVRAETEDGELLGGSFPVQEVSATSAE